MAKIDVGFVELHNDLFFGGKNFGKKLDPLKHGCQGLTMLYDQEEKELIASWMGKVAHVPVSNISSYTPGKAEPRNVHQVVAPQVAGIASAQVETPFGHVHAGPGRGKSK